MTPIDGHVNSTRPPVYWKSKQIDTPTFCMADRCVFFTEIIVKCNFKQFLWMKATNICRAVVEACVFNWCNCFIFWNSQWLCPRILWRHVRWKVLFYSFIGWSHRRSIGLTNPVHQCNSPMNKGTCYSYGDRRNNSVAIRTADCAAITRWRRRLFSRFCHTRINVCSNWIT